MADINLNVGKKMTDTTSENAVTDLFELINGHSVLFAYNAQTRMSELAYGIISSFLETTGVSMSLILFTEQGQELWKEFRWNKNWNAGLRSTCDHFAKFSAGGITCTDMTELLMDIESEIKTRQLLFLEDLAFLRWRHNKIPFMRFLEILSSRVREKKGTTVCTIALNMLDTEIEKLLFSVFDIVLFITEDAIQLGPKKSKDDIQYSLKDSKLVLRSAVSTDMKKIKEIFSLSIEEKEELDKIVHEHIEDFKRS